MGNHLPDYVLRDGRPTECPSEYLPAVGATHLGPATVLTDCVEIEATTRIDGAEFEANCRMIADNLASKQLAWDPEHYARTEHVERRHFYTAPAMRTSVTAMPLPPPSYAEMQQQISLLDPSMPIYELQECIRRTGVPVNLETRNGRTKTEIIDEALCKIGLPPLSTATQPTQPDAGADADDRVSKTTDRPTAVTARPAPPARTPARSPLPTWGGLEHNHVAIVFLLALVVLLVLISAFSLGVTLATLRMTASPPAT